MAGLSSLLSSASRRDSREVSFGLFHLNVTTSCKLSQFGSLLGGKERKKQTVTVGRFALLSRKSR